MKFLVKSAFDWYDNCTFNCTFQSCGGNSCNYSVNGCPTNNPCTCLSYVGCRYAA